MRRKEYAISLGLATPGRGRMSREALDAIVKARESGMTFDDDTPTAPSREARRAATAKPMPAVDLTKRPVATHDRSDHVMGISLRYDIDQMFKGVDSNGKTHVVSGRNACSCGYSLVGHICNTPNTLIGSPLERISVVPV